MYIAEQDCCNSTECPKYSECERALRSGTSHNYYTTGSHTEWCDTEGNCGRLDFYDCGEKGNWEMFLVRQSDQ